MIRQNEKGEGGSCFRKRTHLYRLLERLLLTRSAHIDYFHLGYWALNLCPRMHGAELFDASFMAGRLPRERSRYGGDCNRATTNG